MPAAAHDGVVADLVAHRARPPEEGALEPALAVLEDARPLAHAVLEPERGDVAGGLELGDLPRVLDQAELGEHPGEVGVAGVVAGDEGVDARVDAAEHPCLRGAPSRSGELVEVAGLQAEGVGDLPQRRAAADPQLAVLPVAEELVGVARAARPRVEHGLAVLDDQDRVAGLVAAEVGVRRLGAEAVVGVVGADLEAAGGHDEPLARELLGQPLAAGARPLGDRVRRQVELAVAPAGAHERGVGLGHRRVVALGVKLFVSASVTAHSTSGASLRCRPCGTSELGRLHRRGAAGDAALRRRHGLHPGALRAPTALATGLVLAAIPVSPLIAATSGWTATSRNRAPAPRPRLGRLRRDGRGAAAAAVRHRHLPAHRRLRRDRGRAGHRGGRQGPVHPAAAVLPAPGARRHPRRDRVRRHGRHRLRLHREHPLPDVGLHGDRRPGRGASAAPSGCSSSAASSRRSPIPSSPRSRASASASR